jgi:dTDP-4-dehydrorhamnose 3,5-epimerase
VAFEFRPFNDLPEVILIEPKAFSDERGWFAETYKRTSFVSHGITFDFPQDNQSCSTARGVLRGLHFQKEPAAQGKLVRCTLGEVFDVAVDIRKGSPTYRKWVSTILSSNNRHMVWIPPGFAHGFLTLTSTAEVVYKATCEYSPVLDRVIRWSDPTLAIKWPYDNPILSTKDMDAPLLDDVDNNFVYK